MPGTATPKFSCPSCGKQFTWKPELAGKKGKCKCGGVLSIPATPPAQGQTPPIPRASQRAAPPPPPPPPPVPEGNPFDDPYTVAEEPIDAPPYIPPRSAAAATSTVTRPAVATAGADAAGGAGLKLHVGPSLRWFGIGAVSAALAAWEWASPTDPDAPGRRRGIRAILVLANHIHPRGAFFVLAAFAALMIGVGVLILLGKAKDDDAEHEKNKDKWPASRGK